jgi:hypothetical protein
LQRSIELLSIHTHHVFAQTLSIHQARLSEAVIQHDHENNTDQKKEPQPTLPEVSSGREVPTADLRHLGTHFTLSHYFFTPARQRFYVPHHWTDQTNKTKYRVSILKVVQKTLMESQKQNGLKLTDTLKKQTLQIVREIFSLAWTFWYVWARFIVLPAFVVEK